MALTYAVGLVTNAAHSYLLEKTGQAFVRDARNSLFEKFQSQSIAYHRDSSSGELVTRLVSDVDAMEQSVLQGLTRPPRGMRHLRRRRRHGPLDQPGRRRRFHPPTRPRLHLHPHLQPPRPLALRRASVKNSATSAASSQDRLAGIGVTQTFTPRKTREHRLRRTHRRLLQKLRRRLKTPQHLLPGRLRIRLHQQPRHARRRRLPHHERQPRLLPRRPPRLPRLLVAPAEPHPHHRPNCRHPPRKPVPPPPASSNSSTPPPPSKTLPIQKHSPAPVRGDIRFHNVSFHYVPRHTPVLDAVSLQSTPASSSPSRPAAAAPENPPSSISSHAPTTRSPATSNSTVSTSAPSTSSPCVARSPPSRKTATSSMAPSSTTLRYAAPRRHHGPGRSRRQRPPTPTPSSKTSPAATSPTSRQNGVKLSGGQRQRLSLARAFLSQPKILLRDEPTASVEPESESLIHDAVLARNPRTPDHHHPRHRPHRPPPPSPPDPVLRSRKNRRRWHPTTTSLKPAPPTPKPSTAGSSKRTSTPDTGLPATPIPPHASTPPPPALTLTLPRNFPHPSPAAS